MVDTSDASVDTANTFVWYTDPDLTDSVGTGFMFDWGRPSAEQVNFYVQQISPEGCKSTGSGFVQAVVSDAPEVSYDPSTEEGVEPLTVNFINTTQPDVDNYAWFVYNNVDFDWVLESDEKDFSYVFEYDDLYSPGPDSGYANYLVLLTGINEYGCVDSFFTSISVDAVSELQIPNIFTPNGDGFNDLFAPTIAGLREFEGKIFNKWGRRVAELSLSNPTWDGKDPQTSEISDGVYYYVIRAVGNNGEEYNEKGNVTVIQAQ
jgi:gliding motility-associated-like protein